MSDRIQAALFALGSLAASVAVVLLSVHGPRWEIVTLAIAAGVLYGVGLLLVFDLPPLQGLRPSRMTVARELVTEIDKLSAFLRVRSAQAPGLKSRHLRWCARELDVDPARKVFGSAAYQRETVLIYVQTIRNPLAQAIREAARRRDGFRKIHTADEANAAYSAHTVEELWGVVRSSSRIARQLRREAV